MGVNKKVVILLIILALTGVGVLIYKAIIFQSSVGGGKSASGAATTSNSAVDPVRQQEFNDALKKSAALDQDLDGIPDSAEAKYQTNPASADTDSDGLMDGQEIFIYKTNPLKADTDGDGFADGYEARRGLNPNGPGKVQLLNSNK